MDSPTSLSEAFPVNKARWSRLFLLAGSIAAFSATIKAADEIWIDPIGAASANWSDHLRWLDGSAPPLNGDPALTITFRLNRFGDVSNTSINDLGAPFRLNRMIFENDGTTSLSIASDVGKSLQLTGANPRITQLGLENATLSSPLALAPTSGSTTIDGTGFGTLRINGVISGTSQRLVIAGTSPARDAQFIELTGANTFSGGVTLQSGYLTLGSNTAAGSGAITVNGGRLRLSGVTVANAVTLNSDLLIQSVASSTLSGTITSGVPGTGLTLRSSAATLALTNASTYSGATTIDYNLIASRAGAVGTLQLSGNGSIRNSSAVNVHAGGSLILLSSAANINRIGDTTPVNLRSGLFTLSSAGSSVAPTETVGALGGAGFSTITVTPGSPGARLTASSLNRVEHGTFSFLGFNLGNAFGNNVGNVLFTATPEGLTGGGGAGPATSILPYAVGTATNGLTATSFVTYSAATGIRPLNLTTEYAQTLGASAATDNVRLTAPEKRFDSRAINSLLISNSGGIDGSGVLTVTSGAVMSSGSSSFITHDLSFGSAEANIFVTAGTLQMSAPVSGSGGLTKSGAGVLTLSAANPFTGPLTINAGLVGFSTAANLGADSTPIVFNGTGAGLRYTGITVATLSRNLEIRTGVAELNNTGNSQLSQLSLTGVISGDGGVKFTGGVRGFALNSANTYTGPTILFSRVQIGADSAFGIGGEIDLNTNGSVLLSAPWTTSRTISVSGTGSVAETATLDTANYEAVLNGPLMGSSPLRKNGTGALRITGANPFTGALTIAQGSLVLQGEGGLRSPTASVARGAALTLDNAALPVPARMLNTVVTLNGGAFGLLGNAATNVSETLRGITLISGTAVTTNSAGNTLTLTAPGTASTTLTLASFAANGSELLVRGDNLGGGPAGAFTRVRIDAPVLQNGVLPFVYASASSSSGIASSFAAYDTTTDAAGAIGLRALRPAEYSGGGLLQNPANGGATPVSANFLATGSVAASGAVNTVSNLTMNAGSALSLAPGQTLNIGTPAVLVRDGMTAAINGGTLAFGSAVARFYVAGDLDLSSAISGSAGFRKSGPGTLTFSSPINYTGATQISEGRLRVGAANVFANAAVIVDAGTVFDLNGASTRLGGLSGAGTTGLGSGTLTIGTLPVDSQYTGVITGTGGLVIESGGNPLAVRSFLSTSTYSGGTVLKSGRLHSYSAGALGTGTLTIEGGELATVGQISVASTNVPIILHSDMIVSGGSSLYLFGSVGVSGPWAVESRASNLFIATPMTHTGETRNVFGTDATGNYTSGQIGISGTLGAITASAALRISPGGSLSVSDIAPFAGGSPQGRLADAMPVYLRNATFSFFGNAATATSELTGALNGAGYSTISLTPGAGAVTQLSVAALNRVERGTFLVRGSGLGAAPGANAVNLLVAGQPSSGGSGTEVTIVPWMIGDTFSNGNGSGFVTYDAAKGFRVLDPAVEYSTSLPPATAASNVRLATPTVNDAAVTVNSLVLSNTTISGAGTLAITSGAFLSTHTDSRAVSNALDFGNAEANIFVTGSSGALSLTGPISGSGGLTKSGPLDLILAGANTFTGPVTINGGFINFSVPENLGAGSAAITVNAGSNPGGLSYSGASRLILPKNLVFGGGLISLQSTGGGMLEISGTISGSAIFRPGTGTVALSGVNTYSGITLVEAGSLRVSSDAAFGVSEVRLNSGALVYEGSFESSRAFTVPGTSIVDTQQFSTTWAGPVTGAGAIYKRGTGTLSIGAAANFSGSLLVQAGTLNVDGVADGLRIHTFSGGSTFSGNGRILGTTEINGNAKLAPGNGVGTLTVANVILSGGSTLSLEIASVSAFDQLKVTNNISLQGTVVLSLSLAYDPVDNEDSFLVIENEGTGVIGVTGPKFSYAGTMLEEGTRFAVGTQEFQITYTGGTGNDVVLHATPEPSVSLLSALALAMAGFRRRRI